MKRKRYDLIPCVIFCKQSKKKKEIRPKNTRRTSWSMTILTKTGQFLYKNKILSHTKLCYTDLYLARFILLFARCALSQMTPPSTCYTTSQLNKRYSRDLSVNLFGQQQSYKVFCYYSSVCIFIKRIVANPQIFQSHSFLLSLFLESRKFIGNTSLTTSLCGYVSYQNHYTLMLQKKMPLVDDTIQYSYISVASILI